tara:strand:+ start:1196 stop:1369 length:174 start_codon:yes stop_codon:yes gene_type:complete
MDAIEERLLVAERLKQKRKQVELTVVGKHDREVLRRRISDTWLRRVIVRGDTHIGCP